MAWRPMKGGDGGAYRPPPEPRHWRDNGKVVLTGESIAGAGWAAFGASLVETIDPADRAHLVRRRLYADHGPMTPANSALADPALLRARFGGRMPGVPRRYHPSQVTSRGMPYDSMFDGAAATAARLQTALGIDLGWRTRYPRPGREVYAAGELDRAGWLAGLDADEARRRVQRRCKVRMTRDEVRLEREANAILRASKAPAPPALAAS